MNGEKPFYLSKGIIGSGAALIVGLLMLLSIEVPAEEITTIIESAVVVVGGAIGLYGRWKATKQIK